MHLRPSDELIAVQLQPMKILELTKSDDIEAETTEASTESC